MNDQTRQDDETLSIMATYACRYALGRMTTAPDDFRMMIKRSHPRISTSSLKQIRGDVKEAIDHNRTGDPRIDHPAWVEFFAWLEDIIAARLEQNS